MTELKRIDTNGISSVEEIIEDIQQGKLVILVDDEGRENEGDLIIAADKITPEAINFMARFGRGLICMPVAASIAQRLELEPMTRKNNSKFGTNFMVSIGAREGMTTGISAYDRALTVQVAVKPESTADDISTPGHVFPLTANDDGVLGRDGHTEAAVDLARLAGFSPAAVICEVMNDDGTMARLPELLVFAAQHDIKVGTIAELITYRRATEIEIMREAAE